MNAPSGQVLFHDLDNGFGHIFGLFVSNTKDSLI